MRDYWSWLRITTCTNEFFYLNKYVRSRNSKLKHAYNGVQKVLKALVLMSRCAMQVLSRLSNVNIVLFSPFPSSDKIISFRNKSQVIVTQGYHHRRKFMFFLGCFRSYLTRSADTCELLASRRRIRK